MNRTKILRLRSEKNTDIVRQAVNMLNMAVHNTIDEPVLLFCYVPESQRDCDYEVEFVSSKEMATLSGSDNVLGHCDKANKRIYVRLDVKGHSIDRSQLVSVLMHEILHTIGLSHRQERYSLMNAGDTGVRGVTQYEIADILRVLNHARTNFTDSGDVNHEE